MPEDRELQALFDDLRRREEGQAPAFRLQRRAASQAARAGWRAGATLLVVILIVVIIVVRSRPSPPLVSPPVAQWKAPTDFLLNTPQSKFLRTVPEFGVKKGTL